ncbi:formylglycine-generating enzyme family protein [bacterium]|nr:formylglycine-generating enzyme family protein [bacterium]
MRKLILLFLLSAAASFGAPPESVVSDVGCLQMWPFSRSVVINYKLKGNEGDQFKIRFYGSTDQGATVFDLSERGTLSLDGAEGIVAGAGGRKTIWTPDESFRSVEIDDFKVKVEVQKLVNKTYLVLDLETGSASYLGDVPKGGWTEEYKTKKLVLRKIPAGSFTMGSPEEELGRASNEDRHEIAVSKDFYIGIFEVTQKQYELISGDDPSEYKGSTRPAEHISYNMLRGKEKGSAWPDNSDVDADSFLGKLRAKTKLSFDLPTEAQWEYACRAGTETALNDGSNLTNQFTDGKLAKLGRCGFNREDGKGGFSEHTAVGAYLPNNWGLYDMHGNVMEWCLDWYGGYKGPESDPKGAETGTYRIVRGGGFFSTAYDCRSADRGASDPNYGFYSYYGFRLALVP